MHFGVILVSGREARANTVSILIRCFLLSTIF